MNIALIGPTIEENLAIGYLAAALRKAGHMAEIVSFIRDREYKRIAQGVLSIESDVIGLSMTFQSRARGFLALVYALRKAGYQGHITAGGHFASLAAERLLKDHSVLDSIIRGEGEDSIVELAHCLKTRRKLYNIPGIVIRIDDHIIYGPQPVKRKNLDSFPRPIRKGPARMELGFPTAPL